MKFSEKYEIETNDHFNWQKRSPIKPCFRNGDTQDDFEMGTHLIFFYSEKIKVWKGGI